MIVDFYRDIKGYDTNRKPPSVIINELNKQLPKGYKYIYDENKKHLVVTGVPVKNYIQTMNVTINLDEAEIPSNIPRERVLEYLYRTQKTVELHNAIIRYKDKELIIDEMDIDPISNEGCEKKGTVYLKPAEFPPASPILFETVDGISQEILIRRQPYESLDMAKFANVSFPALKIEWLISDSLNGVQPVNDKEKPIIKLSVTPKDAETVSDAIIALKIFRGYLDGTLLMHGKRLGKNIVSKANINVQNIDNMISLWTDLGKLEGVLGVKFIPSEVLPEEDRLFLNELIQMFLNGNDIIYNEPFDHFHIYDLKADSNMPEQEKLIGRKNMAFSYIDGPHKATLLGAQFTLFEAVALVGFTVTGFVLDKDKNGKGAELYIKSSSNVPWRLLRRYDTTLEAAREHINRFVSQST